MWRAATVRATEVPGAAEGGSVCDRGGVFGPLGLLGGLGLPGCDDAHAGVILHAGPDAAVAQVRRRAADEHG